MGCTTQGMELRGPERRICDRVDRAGQRRPRADAGRAGCSPLELRRFGQAGRTLETVRAGGSGAIQSVTEPSRNRRHRGTAWAGTIMRAVSEQADILVLDEPAVRARLHYKDLIPAIAEALAALSSGGGRVVQPVRTVLPVAPHEGFFAVMPAYAGALGAKLVTFYPKNVGIHTHHALIVMFKPETGEPVAVMDGRLITEMRTAAASAVGRQPLGRGGAAVLAILGSGVQAGSHLA